MKPICVSHSFRLTQNDNTFFNKTIEFEIGLKFSRLLVLIEKKEPIFDLFGLLLVVGKSTTQEFFFQH